MNSNLSVLIITLLTMIQISVCQAQEPAQKTELAYWVRTKDGNEYQGSLEVRNSQELILNTAALGRVIIPLDQIRNIRQIRPEDLAKKFIANSSAYSGRYYLSSSAITMRKNEGFYHNSMFLFNRVEYGITDWWTIGAETGLFNEDGYISGGITNRLTIPLGTNNFHLGAKGTVGILFGDGSMTAQILGLATIGPPDKNVTIGAGYTLHQRQGSPNSPTLQVAGDFRIGRRGAVLFDLHLTDISSEGLKYYIFGGRHNFRRIGLDYAIAFISADDLGGYVLPIPWVGLTVPF